MRLNRRTKEVEAMEFVSVIAANPFSFGIAALGLLYFLLMKALEKAPLMEECSRCHGMWAKSKIYFTGKECLCPCCLTAHCDEKTKENYRQAQATLL